MFWEENGQVVAHALLFRVPFGHSVFAGATDGAVHRYGIRSNESRQLQLASRDKVFYHFGAHIALVSPWALAACSTSVRMTEP
jgi:hypothetical protein